MQVKTKLHHLAIKVHDLIKARNFYKKVLGLDVSISWINSTGELRSIWLSCGDILIMLEHTDYLNSKPLQSTQPGFHLIAFPIDKINRDDWKKHFKKHNVTITNESKYSLYFDDPENNHLALSHFPF